MTHKITDNTRNAGNRRGQAIIEFALVVPMLALIVTGMVTFGIVMSNSLVLTNAVNTGAQVLAVSRGQTTDPCATVTSAIEGAAPGLTVANLSFTYVINGSTFSTTSCGTANMAQGASAEVTVTYPCTFAMYGLTLPACSLQSQTTEMIQ